MGLRLANSLLKPFAREAEMQIETIVFATALVMIIDVSAWLYGRLSLSLDKHRQQKSLDYFKFLLIRWPTVLLLIGSVWFAMIESYKSFSIRLLFTIVMFVVYAFITYKTLTEYQPRDPSR